MLIVAVVVVGMCCNLAGAKAIWHNNLAVSKVVSISGQDYRVQRKEHVSYHTFRPEELVDSIRKMDAASSQLMSGNQLHIVVNSRIPALYPSLHVCTVGVAK